MLTEVQRRERDFHDALAAPLAAQEKPPRPADDLEEALLAKVGNLEGRRVLELGCGIGDLSLLLVERGAVLTALDLSPAMVQVTKTRVSSFYPSATADFLVAPVEQTGLASRGYDLVLGKWILHHSDLRQATREVARMLKPGGRAIFIENSGRNPVLSLARRHLAGRLVPRYGTDDEHPLVRADYEYFGRYFHRVTVDYPDFCFFHLLDRQVLRFRYPWLSRALGFLDSVGWQIGPIRRYSYHVLLELQG